MTTQRAEEQENLCSSVLVSQSSCYLDINVSMMSVCSMYA